MREDVKKKNRTRKRGDEMETGLDDELAGKKNELVAIMAYDTSRVTCAAAGPTAD